MRGLLTPLPALNQGQRGQFPRGKARRGRAEQRLARPGRRAPTAPQEAEGDGWRLTVKASRPAPRAPPPRPPAPLTHPSPQHGAAPRRGGEQHTRRVCACAVAPPPGEAGERPGPAPPRPSPEAAGGRRVVSCSPGTAPTDKREVGEEGGSVGRGALQRSSPPGPPQRPAAPEQALAGGCWPPVTAGPWSSPVRSPRAVRDLPSWCRSWYSGN